MGEPLTPKKDENACRFTPVYWDFLSRHKKRLQGNNRMSMQLKNLERKPRAELKVIRKRAQSLRNTFGADLK
ncbi:hypothetical protein Pr1d_49430 [Bythopirellula goksoeyrii]|uniref:Uncharacterized protein n=1 Tax=Bythopirellula goksoeyrii TaxID=1400387 RepID=A0A5B9QEY0_9BACT|nr:hypothetical protein Pr1d_49430 [Bythopirellula goksoeyrii]